MSSDRYCIVSDEDGHDYVVPVGKKYEFQDWLEQFDESADIDDCEPSYAQRIEGGELTFSDPEYY